jgi:hypothetical protein
MRLPNGSLTVLVIDDKAESMANPVAELALEGIGSLQQPSFEKPRERQ